MRLRLALSLPFAIAFAACTDPQHPADANDELAVVDSGHDTGVDTGIDVIATDVPDTGTDASDAQPDVLRDVPMGPAFCATGGTAVPGAIVPAGYCIYEFAPHTQLPAVPNQVTAPRTMAFASNGDLFVAAPANGAAGGAGGGPGAILVLTDTNHDNLAEVHTFASGISDVHGLAVTDTAIYFTTTAGVWRTDYAPGQLAENAGSRTQLATLSNSAWRWTHGLAVSAAGRVYLTSGVYGASCPDPNVGAIFEVTGGALRMVSQGFRNPMYARCHYRDEVCAIDELGDDGGGSYGAREKMLLLHESSNYGYPCCATTNVVVPGSTASCSAVTTEESSMMLNDTPFGLDWEHGIGQWPAPYVGSVFVAKHGSFYSSPPWRSVGIYWAPTNIATHAPSGDFALFVDGFGASSPQLRRPADVTFSPDGRLFFIDDIGGGVYWVAPTTLRSY